MVRDEAARRRGNCARAKSVQRDAASIAETYERFTRYAGIIIGVAFGLMAFIALIAG